jgi:hypothetical protein
MSASMLRAALEEQCARMEAPFPNATREGGG